MKLFEEEEKKENVNRQKREHLNMCRSSIEGIRGNGLIGKR